MKHARRSIAAGTAAILMFVAGCGGEDAEPAGADAPGGAADAADGTTAANDEGPGAESVAVDDGDGDGDSDATGGECSYAYTLGDTRYEPEAGYMVAWKKEGGESRLRVGDPRGMGHHAQMTFTTDAGAGGQRVEGAGTFVIRFADFSVGFDSVATRIDHKGQTGATEITTYDDGVMVAGRGQGEALDANDGSPVPFTFEFAVSGQAGVYPAADLDCRVTADGGADG